ncbi:MAG: eCIS core domain-containing protein [Egibacteraceae bacterium]
MAGCNCHGEREETTLGRTSARPAPSCVPPVVHEVLRTTGQPLAPTTRAFFEPRLGHDFSHVRVHTDAKAAKSARAVDALAYTVGQHIAFAAGTWAPGSRTGMELLAHELVHTIQQRGEAPSNRALLTISEPADPSERSADYAARQLFAGPAQQAADSTPAQIARQPEDAEPGSLDATDFELAVSPLEVPKPAPPSLFPPGKRPTLKLRSFCNRTILAEGTCRDLALGSKWICCDRGRGYKRPGRTTSIAEPGKSCPSATWTPTFTCDNNCGTSLRKGCDDDDHWMAVPGQEFKLTMCGDRYVVCANGSSTQGYVRDKSSTKTRYEVSPGIQKALGVPVLSSFEGAVYPSTSRGLADVDPCCNGALLQPPTPLMLNRGPTARVLQRQKAPTNEKERETVCTKAQTELIAKGKEEGKSLADSAATALSRFTYPGRAEALQKHFGAVSDPQIETIRARYERIRDSLTTKVVVCLGRCIKSRKHKIECARGVIPGNVIRICPSFGERACDPGLTMLHEAAHNDGAKSDVDVDGAYPPTKEPEDNTYSYENFALDIGKGPPEPKLRPKEDVQIEVPE